MRRLFCVRLTDLANPSDPAHQIFPDHIAQRFNVGVVIVEAWNIGELFAARMFEALENLFVDLFERFDAV